MGERKRTVVEVGALAPLDAKAARVMSGGVHWTPDVGLPDNYVREVEGALSARKPNSTNFDITGQRFGSLVVKGLGPVRKSACGKRKPSVWVVRCDCGAFEHRRAKTLRDLPEWELCCSHCRYLRQVQRGGHKPTGPFNKMGQAPEPNHD